MSTAWIIFGILTYVIAIWEEKIDPRNVYKKDLGFITMLLCFVLSLLNR